MVLANGTESLLKGKMLLGIYQHFDCVIFVGHYITIGLRSLIVVLCSARSQQPSFVMVLGYHGEQFRCNDQLAIGDLPYSF